MKLSMRQVGNSLCAQRMKDSGSRPSEPNRQMNKMVNYTCHLIIWETEVGGLSKYKQSSGYILSSQSAWVTI